MTRLILTTLLAAALAHAAEDPLRFYRAKLDRTHAANADEIRELLDLAGNYRAFTHYLLTNGLAASAGDDALRANWAQLVRAYEQSRALAPESRANLFTFHANAAGLANVVLGRSPLPCCDSGASALRNLSLAISLDPVTNQFAGISARYAVVNSRDPRGPAIKARWIARTLGDAAQALTAPSARVLESIAAAYEAVETNPGYDAWLDAATARLRAAPQASLASELEAELDNLALLAAGIEPQIGAKLVDVLQSYDRYLSGYIGDVTRKPALSLEYAQANAAARTVRAIFDWNPRSGLASFTATAAMTFDGPQRNWEAGAQYEHPIAPSTFLTASAQYDGAHVISEAGVALRLAGSGIRLPIGIVWVDRSRRPGARFGIALDLDTLFIK
jgi:hypothetical protein